jgi:hypothetical protein
MLGDDEKDSRTSRFHARSLATLSSDLALAHHLVMSKSNGRSPFAFQTSYDALAVEQGEETDEEDAASDVPTPPVA